MSSQSFYQERQSGSPMAGRECYVTITCPRGSYEKMLLIIKHHNFGIAHFNNLESVTYDFLIFLIVILLKKILSAFGRLLSS